MNDQEWSKLKYFVKIILLIHPFTGCGASAGGACGAECTLATNKIHPKIAKYFHIFELLS